MAADALVSILTDFLFRCILAFVAELLKHFYLHTLHHIGDFRKTQCLRKRKSATGPSLQISAFRLHPI